MLLWEFLEVSVYPQIYLLGTISGGHGHWPLNLKDFFLLLFPSRRKKFLLRRKKNVEKKILVNGMWFGRLPLHPKSVKGFSGWDQTFGKFRKPCQGVRKLQMAQSQEPRGGSFSTCPSGTQSENYKPGLWVILNFFFLHGLCVCYIICSQLCFLVYFCVKINHHSRYFFYPDK